MAWLESLASKQGAKSEELITRPEDRTEAAPDWVARARTAAGETPAPAPSAPAPTPPEPVDDTPDWLRDLKSAETPAAPGSDRTGSWMRGLEEGSAAPTASEVGGVTDFLRNLDAAPEPAATTPAAGEDLPDWLREIESPRPVAASSVGATSEDLPEWLRDVAEAKPKPTEPEEWKPAAAAPVRQPEPEPVLPTVAHVAPAPEPEPVRQTVVHLTPEPAPAAAAPAAKPKPRPAKTTRSAGPAVPDQVIFATAQDFLKRGDVASALAEYGKLVKRSRMLDETIYDLREALYRFPVEVTLWQMLGDAYMRANRLQDALDAYTKAEELLR